MREYPVFVPFGDIRLGAVVTVPDAEARGLVVLLPGAGGAPRSQRNSMWTVAARRLADHDIASVRMEWPGAGDSTGVARFSFAALPLDPVRAVIEFARRATGIQRLGLAGNCFGARTLLTLAPSLPVCESVMVMLLKPTAKVRGKKGAKGGFLRAVKRAMGKRTTKGIKRLAGTGRTSDMIGLIRRIPEGTHVLLLETYTRETERLRREVEHLSRPNGRQVDVRELPGGPEAAFHSLDRQRYVIDSMVAWFDGTFPAADATRQPLPAATER